jgi:hypothetical protein
LGGSGGGRCEKTIQRRHHQPVVLCIDTHFHADWTAVLEFLFDKDTTFSVGGYTLQTL